MTLLIDYAHNAMSLESLLKTLRKYHPKRLICLFGCGGNRARDRRFQMGEVSGRLADLTVITSDNPRDEEPQAILDDIRTGIGKTEGAFVEIADRKEAIRYVIENRQPGDLVVLAGKGHETYQIRKGKRYEMDERVLIKEVLEETGNTAEDIDQFIIHQANYRIIESIAKRLKVDLEKFPVNMEHYGNTSGASVPILLDELNRAGKLKNGDKLVLAGFGAGLTWGAVLLEW